MKREARLNTVTCLLPASATAGCQTCASAREDPPDPSPLPSSHPVSHRPKAHASGHSKKPNSFVSQFPASASGSAQRPPRCHRCQRLGTHRPLSCSLASLTALL